MSKLSLPRVRRILSSATKALSQNTALDFGYKFFGSLGHDWKFSPGELTSDPILTHALLVSFS